MCWLAITAIIWVNDMSKHKHTSLLCIIIIVIMLIVTVLFMMGETLGIVISHTDPPYVSTLFSTDKVHNLDIVVDEDDWAEMLANASAEEYIVCSVVIDGDSVKNVAIRPKGNSSLSSIATSDSDRYSFKIEFDHYNSAQNFKGLDKLALNNIAQDNTYLKDYISYQMMNEFGADAPLCSFIYITVNGEDWGLYLAVEGIEESFAERNYGSDYGEIYKPDSLNMNAGGGAEDNIGGNIPQLPDDGEMPQFPQDGEIPQMPLDGEASDEENSTLPENGEDNFIRDWGGGGFGGNNSDIALNYSDDEYESYSNIFDNAVFNPSDTDKTRLISSIKQLNSGIDLEQVVNIDEVLRYFVVHNFVLNFDSYTGSMLHNYYLYEKDGQISMIAWDYNLSFGAFSMGGGIGNIGSSVDSATSAVNYPIDTPVSGVEMESRPLLNQLLSNETYLELYHSLVEEFISGYFDSGEFAKMYDNAVALISPYVEKDPTAFCTYDEFVQAHETLREFCLLRAKSINGQLDGSIGSTSEAQAATNYNGFVDASHIDMNMMGSNSMGFGRARTGDLRQTGEQGENTVPSQDAVPSSTTETPSDSTETAGETLLGDFAPPNDDTGISDNSAVLDNTAFDETNQPQNTRENFQMPKWNGTTDAAVNSNQKYWFLVAAIILMAGGLVFAVKFKKW